MLNLFSYFNLKKINTNTKLYKYNINLNKFIIITYKIFYTKNFNLYFSKSKNKKNFLNFNTYKNIYIKLYNTFYKPLKENSLNSFDNYEMINYKKNTKSFITNKWNTNNLITELKNYKLLTIPKINTINNKLNHFSKLELPFLLENNESHTLLHKYILPSNKTFLNNNNLISSTSPKQKQILFQLKHYLKNPFLISNKKIIFPNNLNIFKSLFNTLKSPKKATDIIYGLQNIETIFESKNLTYNSIIIQNGYIINNIKYTIYDNLNSIINIQIFNINKTLNITESLPLFNTSFLKKETSIVVGGDLFQGTKYSPQKILNLKFLSLKNLFNQYSSCKISFIYIQNIIIESLFKQYLNNNILIPIIHFELIAKRMTSCIKIISSGNTNLQLNDILPLNMVNLINIANIYHGYNGSIYKPILLGISKTISVYSGFLSASSFQETIKILIQSALETKLDWLTDWKSKIMFSDLINSGSGWYRFFNKL
uniref:DNA-directed RNA polymerase n=1 Tax=Nephromyces sp. ex Molgula occidentalis TaxID=2544991 RepID=A0A5C1H7Z4_9APIC|nr:plastid-encoded DNA-directed RNA polymerase beta''B [Nephromyces sp. ex Molgula occidentalis]